MQLLVISLLNPKFGGTIYLFYHETCTDMNSEKQFKYQFGLYAGTIVGNANFKQVFLLSLSL